MNQTNQVTLPMANVNDSTKAIVVQPYGVGGEAGRKATRLAQQLLNSQLKPQKLKRKDELRLQDERENVRSERTRPLLSRQVRNFGRFI